MAKSHIVNTNNIIEVIDKLFHNINKSNEIFCNNIKNILGIRKLSENLVYKEFYHLFHITSNKPKLYVKYWVSRGWDTQIAKDNIRKLFKKTKVFFDNDEIYNFIITNNIWKFNLNNTLHILNFVDTIIIDDHITETTIHNLYLSNWCNQYYNNTKNKGYLLLNTLFYIARGYNEEEAKQIITDLSRLQSIYCTDFYVKRGFSVKEALIKISEHLKENASYSKGTSLYWERLGVSQEDAKNKAKYYSSLKSVWSVNYWKLRGLSEEDAYEEIKKYNGCLPECKCYNNDYGLYINSMNNLSKKLSLLWKRITKNKVDFQNHILKSGWLKNTSKLELDFFQWFCTLYDNAKHESYIVLFPEGFSTTTGNSYFYVCDGYLIYDNYVIIIEYDGGYGVFHHDDKDLQRDKDILMIDQNVLGIIRIRDTFWKKTDKNKIKEYLDHGIQKIKDCKEERIIMC